MESNEYVTKEDVNKIVKSYNQLNGQNIICIKNFQIRNANEKLLGFLADYLKLTIFVKVKGSDNSEESKVLQFFVKAVSRVNAAKAKAVKDSKLFSKEVQFYTEIKNKIEIPGLNNWSPDCYEILNDDVIVFDDLNAKNYQVANKMKRFDLNHTKCALRSLAKFHGCSIAYINMRTNQLKRIFSMEEDFSYILDRASFCTNDPWYQQCTQSSLAAIKTFCEYGKNNEILEVIEKKWAAVWSTDEFDYPAEKLKVLCHRDLWNNNIMFKYKDEGDNKLVPENVVFVDYQAIRYQPPATDVMMLLYCNLVPEFREENMVYFLKYYYDELDNLLKACNISLQSFMSQEDFFMSAEKCRKFGLIFSACLMPAAYLDDTITTDIFSDAERFSDILLKNKSEFVIKMMNELPDYKKLLLSIFEEIVKRYCINDSDLTSNNPRFT